MSTTIQSQAEAVRKEAIAKIKASTVIRSDTKRNIELLDETCQDIVKDGDSLTVGRVVRVMKAKFPGDALSERSIRNNTASGNAYKQVIAAWRNYQVAVGVGRRVKLPDTSFDDISDMMIQQIKPEQYRIHVLAMRTQVRNLRKQLQILQMVSPSKVLQHRNGEIRLAGGPFLSDSEKEILEAFLNPLECNTHGLHWNDVGQLQNEDEETLCRPGLRDVLIKILGKRTDEFN